MSIYQFHWQPDASFAAEEMPIRDLVARHGSPLNIISRTQLVLNLKRFQHAFRQGWRGEVRILPAIKANTSGALSRVLSEYTDGCDLFSEGEMAIALENGFQPQFLSLNGNSKLGGNLDFLENAIAAGVRITLDDESELSAVESISKRLGIVSRVRFRVRPNFPSMQAPTDFVAALVPSELANTAYKAGIPTESLIPLGKRALASPYIKVTGVHLHLGRHRSELSYWRAAMEGYAVLIGKLSREWDGWIPEEIDIGGGFAQHLDQMNNTRSLRSEYRQMFMVSLFNKIARIFGSGFRYQVISRLLRLSRARKLDGPSTDLRKETAPTIEDYARIVTTSLRDELGKEGIDSSGITLEVEPGRAIFGNAGIHVARVSFVKRQTSPVPWTWVVTDTSEWFLHNSAMEHPFPVIVDGKPLDALPRPRRMIADIVGKSCSGDRIKSDSCLPSDLCAGDLIVFIGTGAYSEMLSNNMNGMPRPATVLVSGNREGLIRHRETMEEVYSREEVPAWLQTRQPKPAESEVRPSFRSGFQDGRGDPGSGPAA